MRDLVLIAVIAIVNKTLDICQNDRSSIMLIQLIEGDLFSLIIMNLIEVAGINDSDTQIFIIRNKKLFQFIDVNLILVYMQITQIEAFKFKDTDIKCVS